MSTIITAPIDMVKTRLMLQRKSKRAGSYKNGLHCAYQVVPYSYLAKYFFSIQVVNGLLCLNLVRLVIFQDFNDYIPNTSINMITIF